jgi:hypothetical protein
MSAWPMPCAVPPSAYRDTNELIQLGKDCDGNEEDYRYDAEDYCGKNHIFAR